MSSALNHGSLFSYDHTIYWPSKYERVVKFLQNGDEEKPNNKSLYRLNVEVIVLAACVGVKYGNFIDQLPPERKEIALSTFNDNQLGVYIYIIPLLSDAKGNIDLMRNKEGEDLAVTIFQKYAAGGLEILSDRLLQHGLDSPYLFLHDLVFSNGDGVMDIPLEISF